MMIDKLKTLHNQALNQLNRTGLFETDILLRISPENPIGEALVALEFVLKNLPNEYVCSKAYGVDRKKITLYWKELKNTVIELGHDFKF